MSIWRSFADGLTRVLHSPALVFALFGANFFIALPLSVALRSILKESIGHSLMDEKMRQGFDLAWYGEFSSNAQGLGETFGPWVVGILPMLRNLESLLDGNILRVYPAILLPGLAYLLVWAFLSAGILDRYAHPEDPHSMSRLFSKSGQYFFRFVQLLLLSLLLYWLVFRFISRPLQGWLERATREVTAEVPVLLATMGIYALVGFLLVVVTMIIDYAKIALIAQGGRNALRGLRDGLRFVLTNPGKTIGLYLLLLGVGLVLIVLYSLIAPGPGQSSWTTVALAFLVGQVYLLGRLILKLWFLGSQTVLFHSRSSTRGPETGLSAVEA